MAIEFHCPYCTAAIRVPDAAAGKRGTCPKCVTKLLVPAVAPPESPNGLTAPAAIDSPAAALDGFVIPPTELPPYVPAIPAAEIVPAIQTNRIRGRKRRRQSRRKRRQSSGLWVIIPLAVVALLIAVLLFVFYRPPEKLEGTLSGQRVTAVNITPAQLTLADVDASREDFAKALESLKAKPLVLTSALLRTEIRGGENSIEVGISMTPAAEFVAVDVNDPLLKQFATTNELAFGTRRIQRLRQSATQLVSDLAHDGNRVLSDPSSLRNDVALNLLRKGLGFVVEGAAGKVLCPCVYESGDQIWFAVPAGTPSFIVHGRTIAGQGKLFPGRYEVTVSGASEVIEIENSQDQAVMADDDEMTDDADMSTDAPQTDAPEMKDSEKMDPTMKMDGPQHPN